MHQEGPPLESLTRRLAEIPADFLAEPRLGESGRVHVAAVVHDLFQRLGERAPSAWVASLAQADPRKDRNRQAVLLVLAWLLSDDWFGRARPGAALILHLLETEVPDLATRVAATKFSTDPERREELARLALARLGYRPSGETLPQAQDRLATLNSAERARVLQAARRAEERARQIREALARKAAEESADKWTRE